jgi:hypothetical protein
MPTPEPLSHQRPGLAGASKSPEEGPRSFCRRSGAMADAARAAATLRAAAEAVPAAALPADDAAARQALFRRLASAAESSAAAAPPPASLLAPRQLVQLKAQLKVMASLSRRLDVSPELLALARLPVSSDDAGGAAPVPVDAAHDDAAREVRAPRARRAFAGAFALVPGVFGVCALVSCAAFSRLTPPIPQARRRDGGGASPPFDAAAVEGASALHRALRAAFAPLGRRVCTPVASLRCPASRAQPHAPSCRQGRRPARPCRAGAPPAAVGHRAAACNASAHAGGASGGGAAPPGAAHRSARGGARQPAPGACSARNAAPRGFTSCVETARNDMRLTRLACSVFLS